MTVLAVLKQRINQWCRWFCCRLSTKTMQKPVSLSTSGMKQEVNTFICICKPFACQWVAWKKLFFPYFSWGECFKSLLRLHLAFCFSFLSVLRCSASFMIHNFWQKIARKNIPVHMSRLYFCFKRWYILVLRADVPFSPSSYPILLRH